MNNSAQIRFDHLTEQQGLLSARLSETYSALRRNTSPDLGPQFEATVAKLTAELDAVERELATFPDASAPNNSAVVGQREDHVLPLFGKILSDTSWGLRVLSIEKDAPKQIFYTGAQRVSTTEAEPDPRWADLSVTFDMTNADPMDLKVNALYIGVEQYYDATSLETSPAVSGGSYRPYFCNIGPDLQLYECKKLSAEYDFIRLSQNESESFRIGVNTMTQGVYQLSVHVKYVIGSDEKTVRVGALEYLYGFFKYDPDFFAKPPTIPAAGGGPIWKQQT